MKKAFFNSRYYYVFLLSLCFGVEQLFADEQPSTEQSSPEQEVCTQIKKNNFTVRVALDIKPIKDTQIWTIKSAGLLTIKHISNQAIIASETLQSSVTIKSYRNALHCDNKRSKTRALEISSLDKHVVFNDRTYQGSLLILLDQSCVYIINKIALEDYVYSSLGTECWPGWPMQVAKAMAIAIRTYVIKKVTESRAAKKPYHIKNTNIHQTYKGIHPHERIRRAVDETAGLIVTYKNKPIVAMFDGCCGGMVPAHMEGVNFGQAPYLKRDYACTYCKPYKLFSWRRDYELHELTKLFKQAGILARAPLRSLQIVRKDNAGVVHEVILRDNRKKEYSVSGKKMYSLFDAIKSFAYDIIHEGSKVSIIGSGYGHHLGLCQWGAYEMDKQGWSYQEILKFYYVDTKLMRLSLG